MNEKTRKMLVYALSAATVIWAVYNYPGFEKQPEIQRPDTTPQIRQTNAILADKKLVDIEALSAEPWGADPFRDYLKHRTGATGKRANSARWSVSGILYSKDNPLAYVNGRSVRIGDMIDKAKVIAIERKAVILEHKGNQITLSVSRG